MKKLLLTLLLFLFTIPLFSQTVYFTDNNRERLMKQFFSVDTIQKDSTYTIRYTLYVNRLVQYVYPFGYRSFHNRYYQYWRYPYFKYYWVYNYDWWYYNNTYYSYWSYHNNWFYDNYHGYYSNYYRYKPRPPKSYRKRTITTRSVKPINKEQRYTRPRSTSNNSHIRTNTRPSTRSYAEPRRNTSTYHKPNTRRSYNTPTRSRSNTNVRTNTTSRNSSTTVRSGSSSRNSGSARSSSGSRSSSRGRR